VISGAAGVWPSLVPHIPGNPPQTASPSVPASFASPELLFTPSILGPGDQKLRSAKYGKKYQTKKRKTKSAHTALAVKACLLGGKTATLNAQ